MTPHLWAQVGVYEQERWCGFLNTSTLSTNPILTPERYKQFLEVKRGYQRRNFAAMRSAPHEHRPWDRGFNPYEEGGVAA